MKLRASVTLAAALALSLPTLPAAAQDAAALRRVVEAALAGNPDLSAKLHAYRAAADGVDLARSGLAPRLALTGDVGAQRETYAQTDDSSFGRSGIGLSLTQVLWDGLGTRHDVARAGHERLGRYFDLVASTEQTALEAVQALYDVQRYRRLVVLAGDSVDQHRAAAEKIQSRVQAGVGRGVDLEQANARLALAESNLATEQANLHDVMNRYQRVVGELPPADDMPLSVRDKQLPAGAGDALQLALTRSPAISASVEGVRAARAAVRARQSALQPRVEFRLRAGAGHNFNGQEDRRSESSAEILLNWNLFDGGADRARERQQASLLGQAMDLRDKACRDLRQTVAIAFNDTGTLTTQLTLLERNTVAIERARDAYRQQFDIGQRSLLDLLNAENESYTARRALTNAQFDRAIAYARTHAALSQLNADLGIARPAGDADADAAGWSAGEDAAVRCPAQVVEAAARMP